MVLGISLVILILLLLWCSRNEVVKRNLLGPIKYSVTGSESWGELRIGERDEEEERSCFERSVGLKNSVA